jgi:hypothetical protein
LVCASPELAGTPVTKIDLPSTRMRSPLNLGRRVAIISSRFDE